MSQTSVEARNLIAFLTKKNFLYFSLSLFLSFPRTANLSWNDPLAAASKTKELKKNETKDIVATVMNVPFQFQSIGLRPRCRLNDQVHNASGWGGGSFVLFIVLLFFCTWPGPRKAATAGTVLAGDFNGTVRRRSL